MNLAIQEEDTSKTISISSGSISFSGKDNILADISNSNS